MIDLIIVVPVIVGLVQAAKNAGLRIKYAPLLAIGLGIAFFTTLGDLSLPQNLLSGIVAGLTAAGLYSGVKTVVE